MRLGSNPLTGSNPVPSADHQKNIGRLAQLVEHIVDVDKVRGSSPLPPTGKTTNYLQAVKKYCIVARRLVWYKNTFSGDEP